MTEEDRFLAPSWVGTGDGGGFNNVEGALRTGGGGRIDLLVTFPGVSDPFKALDDLCVLTVAVDVPETVRERGLAGVDKEVAPPDLPAAAAGTALPAAVTEAEEVAAALEEPIVVLVGPLVPAVARPT